jgi:dihydrofolate reductase
MGDDSGSESLPWENSMLVSGDVPGAVRALKERLPGDLVVLGSGVLLQSLLRHDLVDALLLTIHPLVLGTGRRLFPLDGPRLALTLTECKPTTTGVIIARYEVEHAPERDGAVRENEEPRPTRTSFTQWKNSEDPHL